MLLQRHPLQKAADLATELGISIRSLHRYIGMLEEMGIPVYAERGPYGGVSLVRGYKMPPLVLTPEGADILRGNRAIYESLEEQEDGSVVVEMSAPNLSWAAGNILMYGPLITALEPTELRDLVRQSVWAVANMYPDPTDNIL